MMEKNVDAHSGGNNAESCDATGPNQHTQSQAFAGDEREAEESNKSRLSSAQHALSPYAFPCADNTAHRAYRRQNSIL